MEHIIICSICGKPSEAFGFHTTCKDCIKQDIADFDRIRDYLYAHPGAKIFTVSTDLDMPVSKIKRYLREGRLEIIEKENLFLRCEKCGKSICSGTLCDDCLAQSAHEYKSTYIKDSTKNGAKITYLK